MEPNVFTAQNLVFSYGKNRVLDGLSFSLRRGKVTTLIGANGCGKSTLFRLMTKNLKLQQGEVFVNGQALSQIRLRDFAKQAAIVHQHNTAPADLTVEKLVAYGRTPYQRFGLSPNPKEDREKVLWAMEVTNTLRHKDRQVSELSGGQKS